MRPRAVRTRKPCWMRKGSITSSSVPALLADGRRDAVDSRRSAVEPLDDRREKLPVQGVEALRVDLEQIEGGCRDRLRDAPVGLHLGVVAHPSQQPVGDSRRTPGALRDAAGPLLLHRHAEDGRGAPHDALEILHAVELEPLHDAEPVPQRRGQEPGAGRRADQGEGRQVELDRARRRSLPDHDVELKILQRGIEHFLDDRREAVDLIDEEHIARLQVGQDGREIPGALQHGAGGLAQADAELRGDDVGERRLAETRAARR